MTVHFYFVPIINIGSGPRGGRGPKYMQWGNNTGISARWSMIDYGHIDLALMAADTSLADHQSLFDQPDVLSIDPRTGVARDLEQTASSAEITALVSYLDNAGNFCPMGWAGTNDTRHEILRGVCGMFLFIQNVTALLEGQTPKDWGINLNTTWAELTQQQQNVLLQAASNLGYNAQMPSSGTTMRQILRQMAIYWGNRPVYFGGLAVL